MMPLSRTGSIEPSTWVMLPLSKHRRTWMIAFVLRMLPRNLLPRPSPFEAPFTRPAMSTISIVVGTTRLGLSISARRISRRSGTVITPTLGSMVQKGKFAACAFALDRQLKDQLPTFGKPTMPHVTPFYSFRLCCCQTNCAYRETSPQRYEFLFNNPETLAGKSGKGDGFRLWARKKALLSVPFIPWQIKPLRQLAKGFSLPPGQTGYSASDHSSRPGGGRGVFRL